MLAQAFENNLPSGLYNIQGKETVTVKEIVTEIHHAMGKEVPEGCFGSVQRADVGMKYRHWTVKNFMMLLVLRQVLR